VNNAGGGFENTAALQFISDIEPYLTQTGNNDFFLNMSTQFGSFFYRSVADTNYQTYGALILTNTRPRASENDGGYFPSATIASGMFNQSGGHANSFYEIGEDPKYCRDTYFSSTFGTLTRCNLGS